MTTPPVTTITDELLAELEQLAKISSVASGGEEWIGEHDINGALANQCDIDFVVKSSSATILALLQRVRELKADSARLDFMLREECIMQSMNGSNSPVVYSLCWPHTGERQIDWRKSEREAID